MADDDRTSGDWPPDHRRRLTTALGQDADRRTQAVVSEMSEFKRSILSELEAIKRSIESLKEKQGLAASASERNGWKIEAVDTQITGKDGLKDEIRAMKAQIDVIRADMPDLKTARNLVVGFVSVLLTSFASWMVYLFKGGPK